MISDFEMLAISFTNSLEEVVAELDRKNVQIGDTLRARPIIHYENRAACIFILARETPFSLEHVAPPPARNAAAPFALSSKSNECSYNVFSNAAISAVSAPRERSSKAQ